MAPRIALPTRLPIRPIFRAPAPAPLLRFNSNTSTSRAARVIELAAQTEKPSALEAGVPLLWAATGVLGWVAWGRMADEGVVEKLLIV